MTARISIRSAPSGTAQPVPLRANFAFPPFHGNASFLPWDALTLEKEALKLAPLARIQLAELLYASLETEADQEWERKVSDELDSRWQAYQRGELGSSEGFGFLDRLLPAASPQ